MIFRWTTDDRRQMTDDDRIGDEEQNGFMDLFS